MPPGQPRAGRAAAKAHEGAAAGAGTEPRRPQASKPSRGSVGAHDSGRGGTCGRRR
jgi:hypothetical protein